mmetsp:Transcript_2066/g.4700  ORF Transcript_2066/g.4700 Transcript_2066/m.4700 type:complete len:825 (+) Transcript_2066:418-2892(+)
MVQFGTKLHTNKVAKWAEFYVDYNELKRLIKEVRKRLDEIKQRSVNFSNSGKPNHRGRHENASNDSQQWNPTTPSIPEFDVLSRASSTNEATDEKKASEPSSAPTPTSPPVYSLNEHHSSYEEDIRPHRKPRVQRAWTSDETTAFAPSRTRFENEYGTTSALKTHSSSVSTDDSETWGEFNGRQSSVMDASVHLELLRSENPDQVFIEKVKKEALKVNTFYLKTLDEFQKKHTTLLFKFSQLRSVHAVVDIDVEEDATMLSKDTLSADSVKRAFRDLYREMNYLQNFAILNYTAFVKILKKHDKATGLRMNKPLTRYLHQHYEDGFIKTERLHQLIESVERDFANNFCAHNVTVARSELLLKQETVDDWDMLHIGLRLGMVIVLVIWVLWDVAIDAWIKPDEAQMPPEISRIFRGFGFFVVGLWMWAFCIYVWTTERIHYIYLFEFDPRRTLLPDEMLSKASMVTLVYLTHLLVYIKIARGELFNVPISAARYIPLILFAYMTLLFIFPIEQNGTILNAIFHTVFPFSQKVTFFYSFVGDVLTSLTKPLVDVAFTFCFFFTGDWHRMYNNDMANIADGLGEHGSCADSFLFTRVFTPMIIAAPLIFRMLQNMRRYWDTNDRFPHLLNAAKYAFSNLIVLLGAFHPTFTSVTKNTSWYKSLWVGAFVVSTLFTYYWDIVFDWGLCKKGQGLLREHLMLPDKRYYYCAMVIDLVLRFTWCLTLIPQLNVFFNVTNQAYTVLLLGITELIRRTIWTIIRVEHEHNYNDLGYRRVTFVPLDFRSGTYSRFHRHGDARSSVMLELGSFGTIVLIFCIIAIETGGDADSD